MAINCALYFWQKGFRFFFFFFHKKKTVAFDEDTQFQTVRYSILKSKQKELLFISLTLLYLWISLEHYHYFLA